ncbi:MAG: short-chain dehydrogenase [Marmoricola sp.]|nr:short-chain dehydrogenase [Marmoricola sp.]
MDVRTIVVTGASDGIGLEAASQLAAQGHRLVLVGRSPGKVAAAAARLVAESPTTQVGSFVCDFSVLDDVRRLADDLLAICPRIDVLVSNAGTAYPSRTLVEGGLEATFVVNHLAGFLLTELLLDRIIATGDARIVITSSVGHAHATMNFDDLHFERGYQTHRAYCRSKLANVLYTRHLARRLEGTGVTVNAVHPGAVATSIYDGSPPLVKPIMNLAKRLVMISPARGGAALTRLATNDDVAGLSGQYFTKDRVKEPARLARDRHVEQRLLQVSRQAVALPPVPDERGC